MSTKSADKDIWYKDPAYSYNGNQNVKRDRVEMDFSEFEIQEYLRCMSSPVYFVKNYIKVINLDRGLVSFEPYPYQEKMFDHFDQNRFSIVLACRQSGNAFLQIQK